VPTQILQGLPDPPTGAQKWEGGDSVQHVGRFIGLRVEKIGQRRPGIDPKPLAIKEEAIVSKEGKKELLLKPSIRPVDPVASNHQDHGPNDQMP